MGILITRLLRRTRALFGSSRRQMLFWRPLAMDCRLGSVNSYLGFNGVGVTVMSLLKLFYSSAFNWGGLGRFISELSWATCFLTNSCVFLELIVSYFWSVSEIICFWGISIDSGFYWGVCCSGCFIISSSIGLILRGLPRGRFTGNNC